MINNSNKYKELAFQSINEKFENSDKKKLLSKLWDSLEESVFKHTYGPYPVSHSADHIAHVIIKINSLLDAIIIERVCDKTVFFDNLDILYSATFIHDCYMLKATLETFLKKDTIRKQHSDINNIRSILEDKSNSINIDSSKYEVITLLAASHADSENKNGKLTTIEDKVKELAIKFLKDHPYIILFSRLLQFADLLDIRKTRLNEIDLSNFKENQTKHYYKQKIFQINIKEYEKVIKLSSINDYSKLSKYEYEELKNDLCTSIEKAFLKIETFCKYGWKIKLPDENFDIHHPQIERRIRIQANNECNLKKKTFLQCKNCHWEQFTDNISPHYNKVIELINNIKKDVDNTSIVPRPNISFTLTGGEPFYNDTYFEKFIITTRFSESNSITGNSSYILTNATLIDDIKIKILKENGLRNIRISLNYNNEGKIVYLQKRLENIKKMINEIERLKIRFNHVVISGKIEELNKFKKIIMDNFKNEIPEVIHEIAFIQDINNDSYDIFKIAEKFSEDNDAELINNIPGTRKIETRIRNDLKISFIKLNCDVRDDIIRRCFSCVKEQDIEIAADARVHTCTKWNNDLKPIFKDAQINLESPLIGISGVIKKKYGIAGFYGHFPFIIKLLKNDKSLNEVVKTIRYDQLELSLFIKENFEDVNKDILKNFDSCLNFILENILKVNSIFKKLYEEGKYKYSLLNITVELCILLLKAIYEYSRTSNLENKIKINLIFLILAYLTVDEELFSTGRTIIIKGIAESLLRKVCRKKLILTDDDFIIFSTYCIATIALENIEAGIIIEYINFMLTTEQKDKYCQIQYLLGCINRQLKEKDKAIEAFKKAYNYSNEEIDKEKNTWLLKLNKEIRAESQRSLGAIKKRTPSQIKEAEIHFLKARFHSSSDESVLRYHSLFSYGYAALLEFFNKEYSYKKKDFENINGYRAYHFLNESISINPNFYASLIRISLLDLAFENYSEAIRHCNQANKVFYKKGLLTDQEYLNKIMCDYINLFAEYEDRVGNLDRSKYITLLGNNIEGCINIGQRDIECVIEDMHILKIIIKAKYNEKIYERDFLTELVSHIDRFNSKCNSLAVKKAKENAEREGKEFKKYNFLEKINRNEIFPYDFHHICIQTNNFEASYHFYKNILGGEEIADNEDFHNRAHNTWIRLGNMNIELQTPKNDGKKFLDWDPLNSGPVHISLIVSDVEKMYKQIKNTGYKHFKEKDGKELYEIKDRNIKIFKVIAPEGTEIEIRDNYNIVTKNILKSIDEKK